MKKIALIVFSIILLYLVPGNAVAGTMGVGAYTAYTWWDPSFKDELTLDNIDPGLIPFSFNVDYEMKPQFLYGPALSYTMEDWSFTLLFLAGRFLPETSSAELGFKMSPDIWRYDVDMSAGYQILSFMKIFLGLKYQHYSWDYSMSTTGTLPREGEVFFNSPGLSLGVSFNVNIAGNLSLTCNLSGLYQMMLIKSEAFDPNQPIGSEEREQKSHGLTNSLGCNVVVGLAYYFETISTSISLGGRYQYLYIFRTNNDDIDGYTERGYDQLLGVYVSAMYYFEI